MISLSTPVRFLYFLLAGVIVGLGIWFFFIPDVSSNAWAIFYDPSTLAGYFMALLASVSSFVLGGISSRREEPMLSLSTPVRFLYFLLVGAFVGIGIWLFFMPNASSNAQPIYYGPHSLTGHLVVMFASLSSFVLSGLSVKRKVSLWLLAVLLLLLLGGGLLIRGKGITSLQLRELREKTTTEQTMQRK